MATKSRKKVIFVSPYFPPHAGGLENYVANIRRGLQEEGWETVVVTTNPAQGYSVSKSNGFTMYSLPVWFTISNTPVNLFWYFYLKKIFSIEKPDLINAHAPVPGISDMAAWAAGTIPFILTYHAGTMKKGNNPVYDFLISIYENFFMDFMARKAVKIICSSNFVRNSIMAGFKEKAVVVNPAVNTTLFRPSETSGEENTVLFVGRFANMYRMKGLFYLMKAIKKLPGVRLRVIGEPIKSDSDQIEFLGVKSGPDLVKEIQKSSLLVLPSLAHAESFGMVLIEAMACKKPVIGTRVGGIPGVIEDGKDGFIVPPANVKALKEAIEEVLHRPGLARTMGENGFKKVSEQFTWDKKAGETSNIFNSILQPAEAYGR